MDERERRIAAAEAILFTMGNAVAAEHIAKALDISLSATEEILSELRDRCERDDRGVRILQLEDRWQMCTKTEYYEELIRIARQPKKVNLTNVLLETLSIIAYKQPVTKLEISKIRGVNSDHAVNKLVEYELVEELGRMDAPGRPIVFGTTEEFLRHFGISSLEQLPQVDEQAKEKFKAQAEEEIDTKLKV